MEHVIPLVVLQWLASIPPQVWVWINFIALIWAVVGVPVAIARSAWLLSKTQRRYVDVLFNSLLWAVTWPVTAICYAAIGFLWVFVAAYSCL